MRDTAVIVTLLCFLMLCRSVLTAPPSLNELYPRSLPGATGNVLLEGSNFGNSSTAVDITFRVGGFAYSACSYKELLQTFTAEYINCTLSENLPYPSKFNVTIVHQTNGNTSQIVSFETGITNQQPSVADFQITQPEDTTFTITLPAGTDVDGDSLEYYFLAISSDSLWLSQYNSSASGSRGADITFANTIVGTKIIDDSRRIRAAPRPTNWNGNVIISYLARDSKNLASEVKILTITITPVNDRPWLNNMGRSFLTNEDTARNIDISYDDPDNVKADLNLRVRFLPWTGKLYYVKPDGTPVLIPKGGYDLPKGILKLRYVPSLNVVTWVNFGLIMFDGITWSNSRDYWIEIRPINDPPQSFNVTTSIYVDSVSLVTLGCDDVDSGSLDLRYQLLLVPPNTTSTIYRFADLIADSNTSVTPLSVNDTFNDNKIWVIPSDNFLGNFILPFQCADNQYESDISYLTVLVKTSNLAPVLECQGTFVLPSDFVNGISQKAEITLSALDPNNDDISFQVIQPPASGKFVFENGVGVPLDGGFLNNKIYFSADGDGGRRSYTNFSYVAVDAFNSSSDVCNVELVAICDPPYYLNIFNNATGPICTPCPLGAVCSSDGRFLPYAAKGYWKVNDPRYLFLPCSPPAACPGSTSQICAEGYSGVRCGECQPGYYRQLTNCLSCQQSMQLAVVLIAAFLILLLICIYCLINHTRLGGPTFGIVSITLNFFQTIAIIREVNLKWPDEIRTVLDKFSLAMLNIEFLSPECFVADGTLNYSSRLKIILALPIAIFVVISLIIGISKLRQQASGFRRTQAVRQSHPGTKTSISPVSRWITLFRSFNAFMPMVYMTVASYALAQYDCSQEADGIYYMDIDISLRCYDERWAQDLYFAIPALIIYVIGIPLYFMLTFVLAYQKFLNGAFWIRARSVAEKLIENDKSYKKEHQFFLFVQIIQKLLLVAVNMFFTRYIAIQMLASGVILLTSFQFHLKYKPYAYKSLNILELLSSLSSVAVLFLGLLFFAEQFKSYEQKLITIILILSIIFGFTFVSVCCAAYETSNLLRRLFGIFLNHWPKVMMKENIMCCLRERKNPAQKQVGLLTQKSGVIDSF